MNETELKESRKEANKSTLIFVAKLLFFYFLFSQGNLLMNSVSSDSGRFHNAFLAENFNYIQWLKSSIIIPATAIIKLFGFYAIHNEMDVMVVNGPYLRIAYSCLGLGVMSFLFAFAIAFPSKLTAKYKLLIVGTLLIYILNVLRIAGLGILLGYFKSQRNNFNYHHEIFNLIVYILIFLLLFYWIKKNTSPMVEKVNDTKID